MTAEVKRILDQCKAKGIILEPSPDGEYLDLYYQEPPPEGLRQLLREHKAEILASLKPQPPLWHARKIAEAVEKEGSCLFWSDVLQEVVGFVKDDSHETPGPFVFYTVAELQELHKGKGTISPATLRLLHEAKRVGGCITSKENAQPWRDIVTNDGFSENRMMEQNRGTVVNGVTENMELRNVGLPWHGRSG